jgi:hypothetical protein
MTGQSGPHGRFGQLTFTSFDDGRGPVGWRTRNRSELTGEEQKGLEAAITTQLATVSPIPQFPTPDEQAALPRRLMYAPAWPHGVAYWHSVPAGPDPRGRPGNVFVHVVLDRTPGAPEPAFRPPEVWRSPHWLAPFGQAQVLAVTPATTGTLPWRDGVLDRARVLQFLLDPEQWRIDVLAGLLDAVAEAMRRPQPRGASGPTTGVVLGTVSPESGAHWIAAIAQFMSPTTSRYFHWSTLESPADLPAVFAQGVHLAVVPAEHLPAVPAGHVVVHELEQLKPRLPGADPHRTQAGSTITVTPWSSVVREVLQDLPTAEKALDLQDSVAAAVGDRNLEPGWALAMAVAQMPELDDAYADAAQLVGEVSPAGLRAAPALARVRKRLLGGLAGGSTDEAYAQVQRAVTDGADVGPAWSRYLERALDDDRWLQRPGGVPLPPPDSPDLVRYREAFAEHVRHRLDQVLDAPEPTGQALLAIRLADITARCGLHETSDGVHLLRTAQVAVDRCAAPVLLDAADAPALLDAVGPLDEATQDVVVRPALAPAVDRVPRPRGDRVSWSVMRWLFPEPPSPPGVEEIFGAGRRPDGLVRELAAQVTSVVSDPSAFALLALADAVADLPATPVPAGKPSRAAREVDRLMSGRSWRPDELRVVAGRTAGSPGVAEALLRTVVAERLDDDMASLFTEIERSAQGRPDDGVDTAAGVLLTAVRARRLADSWWRGPEPEVTSRRARELISAMSPLLPALAAHRLPPDQLSDQLLASAAGAVAVAAIGWPGAGAPVPMGQELLAALRDHTKVVEIVDQAVRHGVVAEIELVHAALCGASGYPLADTVASPVRQLGGLEVVVHGQRLPLLEQVVARRVQRSAIDVVDVNERVLRLVGQQLLSGFTIQEADHQVLQARAFAQSWWAQRGAPHEIGSGGSWFRRHHR